MAFVPCGPLPPPSFKDGKPPDQTIFTSGTLGANGFTVTDTPPGPSTSKLIEADAEAACCPLVMVYVNVKVAPVCWFTQ